MAFAPLISCPTLLALLAQPAFAPEAGLALSFMGAAAVTPLRDALTSDQVIVRREALRSLGKLRERASLDPQIVIPSLLTALTDPEPSVREVAVTYLGIVRDDPRREVPGLVDALRDTEASVRQAAAVSPWIVRRPGRIRDSRAQDCCLGFRRDRSARGRPRAGSDRREQGEVLATLDDPATSS